MRLLSEKELNILRGKVLVNGATREEMLVVFGHIDAMEERLDEAEGKSMFLGKEGWRHWMRLPDAD